MRIENVFPMYAQWQFILWGLKIAVEIFWSRYSPPRSCHKQLECKNTLSRECPIPPWGGGGARKIWYSLYFLYTPYSLKFLILRGGRRWPGRWCSGLDGCFRGNDGLGHCGQSHTDIRTKAPEKIPIEDPGTPIPCASAPIVTCDNPEHLTESLRQRVLAHGKGGGSISDFWSGAIKNRKFSATAMLIPIQMRRRPEGIQPRWERKGGHGSLVWQGI